MLRAEQGDILKVASIQYPLVVVSKNFFNESGMVMACPILRDAVCGPLRIRTSNAEMPGYVYCEQLRIVDLKPEYKAVFQNRFHSPAGTDGHHGCHSEYL